jgi:hypothetical protein
VSAAEKLGVTPPPVAENKLFNVGAPDGHAARGGRERSSASGEPLFTAGVTAIVRAHQGGREAPA